MEPGEVIRLQALIHKVKRARMAVETSVRGVLTPRSVLKKEFPDESGAPSLFHHMK